MSSDKRRWKRSDVSALGTFVLPQQHVHGVLHAVDFCRQGIRAQVKRSIPRGSTLGIELHLPQQKDATWVTGRVVWVKINSEPNRAYQFETGIQFDRFAESEAPALMLTGYEDEYLANIAETAHYKGILFRNGVRGRGDHQFVLPAGLVVYSAVGAVAAFAVPGITVYYLLSLLAYYVALATLGVIAHCRNVNNWGVMVRPHRLGFLIAGIMLAHVCRGIYFLQGLLKRGQMLAQG